MSSLEERRCRVAELKEEAALKREEEQLLAELGRATSSQATTGSGARSAEGNVREEQSVEFFLKKIIACNARVNDENISIRVGTGMATNYHEHIIRLATIRSVATRSPSKTKPRQKTKKRTPRNQSQMRQTSSRRSCRRMISWTSG